VGGRKDIVVQSPWIGNLYAPRARVLALKALEVWGSVFCAEFESAADASIVFDRAIYTVGSSCEAARPPAGFCSQCGFCSAGTACVDGECGPCRTDGDCCSQNICANGSCVPLVALQ
jgi:hypothetical protein